MNIIDIEIFNKLFTAIAEEMGIILRRSAFSSNIKERCDFSCAIFAGQGELIAQAAHIPVHLGAMPATVRHVLAQHDLQTDDVAIVNNPFAGGSHLPDITLIAPVTITNVQHSTAELRTIRSSRPLTATDNRDLPIDKGQSHTPQNFQGNLCTATKKDTSSCHLDAKSNLAVPPSSDPQEEPIFYVACRAHHADVGGITPGSMGLCHHISEEGIIIPPTLLQKAGQLNHNFLNDFLAQVRNPEERRGDLQAQIAALERGKIRLMETLNKYGQAPILASMAELNKYGERLMRQAIAAIPDGRYQYTDALDNDGQHNQPLNITVTITIAGDTVTVDFRHCADQVTTPLNAVRSVTVSATMYVMQCLVGQGFPLNQGSYQPITIITRPGSILDATWPHPVAAGNVETSQRVVDVLLGALALAIPARIPAASCGSMNNIAIGNSQGPGEKFTYYETIGGGMGAGPNFSGPSGIHSHMTNTLNTPIEALEHSFPLMIERYALRHSLAGKGQHDGGAGIIRSYRFQQSAQVSLLTERRRTKPYGLKGGNPGQPGKNIWKTAEKKEKILPGKTNITVHRNEVVTIMTPGGGGWGYKKK